MNFIHLHTHSHYSLLDGLSKVDELIDKAKEYNMPTLALTDHGTMYGVIEFYTKAKKAGIKPIIGVEVYLARNGRFQKRPKIDEKPYHLVLLAKNEQGYKNLIKLTTQAHLEGFYYKPRIDWELLEQHSEGLIALTACLQGEIPRTIVAGNLDKAEELILKHQNLFGKDNFYLEVQHHPGLKEQAIVNNALFSFGKKLNIPVVATNDSHYINSDDAEAQDILLCLQTKKKKQDKDRLSMLDDDFSFRSPKQMVEDFKDRPEVIANTEKIADTCNLEIELEKIKLPHFNVPSNKTPDEYLEELCRQGLEKKYKNYPQDFRVCHSRLDRESILNASYVNKLDSRSPIGVGDKLRGNDTTNKALDKRESPDPNPQEIQERLEYELGVIEKTGYAPYFLIVQDFVNWAKGNEIIVGPGRGSAAGSIVSYLLNITGIEPLKYDLLFERFLNPERISMPDIDLDFADDRRNEVIDYVCQKYGTDHVSQIITFGTMAARAAIRDVGRVLDFPYNFCDKIAKLIPMMSNLEKALNAVPELKEMYQSDAGAKKIIDMAKKLEGVARHASTHACGVLITPEPLDQYVPLQKASSSDQTIVAQYDMISIEKLGLLKMDFLGLKNLTLLQNAIKKIQITRNIDVDINNIPLDDKKVFKLLQKGETTGVFQLESSGMTRYLKQLKPTCLEDIIAMVALYRPGPMEWIPEYIKGKHGKKDITYLHPTLKPILEKTYGIAVYQEQVLQMARDLAGFSLGEADILRKAVGKKIPKLLAEQKNKFIQGCVDNGVQKHTAEKVFSFIEPFAGYGFNKAHATCYAMISYQTAYLKANFPTEFMAALLISDQNDSDRVAIEVEECKQMGIEVLPPDINESFKDFTVVVGAEKPTIRFGLLAIKNVGSHIVEVIIKERQENGLYQNLEDLLKRVKDKDLNKKSLESLIKSGALDKFGERGQMLHNIDQLLSYAKLSQKEKENGQKSLFGSSIEGLTSSLKLRPVQPAPQNQRLSWERELLGLYISRHPMENFELYLKEITIPCSQISTKINTETKVAGVITKVQRVITRTNEIMLFVKIEDATGNVETLVFPSLLKESQPLWQEEKTVIISGRISDKDGTSKLIANDVFEITPDNIHDIKNKLLSGGQNYPKTYQQQLEPKEIQITIPASFINNEKIIEELKTTLKNFPGNRPVYLIIKNENGTIRKLKTNFLVNPCIEFKEQLQKIIG